MLCSSPLLNSIVVPSLALPGCSVDIALVSNMCCPHALPMSLTVLGVAFVSVRMTMSGFFCLAALIIVAAYIVS